MNRLFLGLLAAAVAFPVLANARGDGARACKDDVEKLCKDVEPGGGRIIRCLKDHKDELSDACKEAVGRRGGQFAACMDDKDKFCADAKPGRGGIMKCMMQHKDELSDGCKATLATKMKEVKGAMAGFQDACGDDVKSLCKDVEPGGGRILRCLREHKDDLSDSCKSFAQSRRKRAQARKGGGDQSASPDGSGSPGGDSARGGDDSKGSDDSGKGADSSEGD